MMPHTTAEPLLRSVHTHFARHRVLLVDPGSDQATLLLAALLADPPCPLYCYQPGMNDTSLETFLTGLCLGLRAQHPLFGRSLTLALEFEPDDLASLVDGFLCDLADLSAQDFLLLLLDFDRVHAAPGIQTFFEEAIERLPGHCHLLFTSRTLPLLPWVGLIARHQAAILKGAQLVVSGF